MNKFFLFSLLLAVMTETADAVAQTSPPETSARFYNRVTGIAAGDTAKVQTWDFSDATIVEGNIPLKRTLVNDSTYKESWLGMNYLLLKRDNATHCMARSNRLMTANDTKGSVELVTPLVADNYAEGEYLLEGAYSQKLQMIESGFSSSKVDSHGTLILPNDTIGNVVRVRTDKVYRTLVDDSVSTAIYVTAFAQLPEVHETVFRWFVPESEFPLAIVSEYSVMAAGEPTENGQTAYILDTPGCQEKTVKPQRLASSVILNKVVAKKRLIDVAFEVENAPSDITFAITDNTGRVSTLKRMKDVDVGTHEETIDLGAIPQGNYIFAIISSGENEQGKRMITIK